MPSFLLFCGTRLRDVYCWVHVCNQYSILIVLCGERICAHRICHTHVHWTLHIIPYMHTASLHDCSLHNYLTFFRLWCRFSLCFEFTCVSYGINNNLRSFFMMSGKLHASTHCTKRWSIIYFAFNVCVLKTVASSYTWKDTYKRDRKPWMRICLISFFAVCKVGIIFKIFIFLWSIISSFKSYRQLTEHQIKAHAS